MVGEGPDKQAAMDYCLDHGIADSVKFIGKSNQVFEVLCYSDLFILPSETESFGLAALEAMASGVPVISSNSGGIPEVNIEGVSGFLSPVGALDDMAHNAIKIIKDEAVLNKFKKVFRESGGRF